MPDSTRKHVSPQVAMANSRRARTASKRPPAELGVGCEPIIVRGSGLAIYYLAGIGLIGYYLYKVHAF
jgi:hypothetical protein